MSTVYASSGGQRYHATPDCPKLLSAQELWDWDCDDYCRHDHGHIRPVRELSATEAAAQGKRPCFGCKPEAMAAPMEHFGHEPMTVRQVGNGRLHAEFTACARCYPATVAWPCPTARVLGLADDSTGEHADELEGRPR